MLRIYLNWLIKYVLWKNKNSCALEHKTEEYNVPYLSWTLYIYIYIYIYIYGKLNIARILTVLVFVPFVDEMISISMFILTIFSGKRNPDPDFYLDDLKLPEIDPANCIFSAIEAYKF